MQEVYLCLDVGGTEIKAAPLDKRGNFLAPVRHFPAMAGADRQTLLENFGWIFSSICPENAVPIEIDLAFPGPFVDAFCKPEHFERYLPDYANLDELKAHYTRGGLGDVKVKKFLNNIIQEELEPIRKRRKEYEKDIPEVYNILRKGTEAAREVAAQTLSEVKSAMKINYFDDVELIKAQSEKYKGI